MRRYTKCWMGSALLKLSEQERRFCGVGIGAQAIAATMKSALGQSPTVLCKHQETLSCLLCMSSEHFGQLAWQFKRMSGSSGLKVQAVLAGTRSDRRCLVERSGFGVRCR